MDIGCLALDRVPCVFTGCWQPLAKKGCLWFFGVLWGFRWASGKPSCIQQHWNHVKAYKYFPWDEIAKTGKVPLFFGAKGQLHGSCKDGKVHSIGVCPRVHPQTFRHVHPLVFSIRQLASASGRKRYLLSVHVKQENSSPIWVQPSWKLCRMGWSTAIQRSTRWSSWWSVDTCKFARVPSWNKQHGEKMIWICILWRSVKEMVNGNAFTIMDM